MTPDQFRAFQKLMDRQIEAIQNLDKTLGEIRDRMPVKYDGINSTVPPWRENKNPGFVIPADSTGHS